MSCHVNSSTYIGFSFKNNKEDLKFRIVDHVRLSKYKNIFAKGYTPNWSKEVFVIKKVKNTVLRANVINDLIILMITKKDCKKQIRKSSELKK